MEELKRLREQKGWSQARLAQESGVDRATINQVEGGRRSPTIATLEVLAEALGVEIADLFPKAQAPLFWEVPEQEPPEERRSPLASWAAYARRLAARTRSDAADPHSHAFRDPRAALFFIEERNHDAAELWRHFEEELGRKPLADEPLAALEPALAAFEELTQALAEVQRRAERMAAGVAESELGQARRRAAEAEAQREQAAARFNARWEKRGA